MYFSIFKPICKSIDLNISYKVYYILDYVFDSNFKAIIKPKSEFIDVLDKARGGGGLVDVL
jgi:hypothetical protein